MTTAPSRVLRAVRLLSVAALVVSAGGPLLTESSAAPVRPAPLFESGNGLSVLWQRQVGPREFIAQVATKALPEPAEVRVLLPRGYSDELSRRYPVLYLFHGTRGRPGEWTDPTRGDARALTDRLPLIVVMPAIEQPNSAGAGNAGGWCTDWRSGLYRWETFEVAQVLPWIDANLRTRTARSQRAVAGLSQGGRCALGYASRHPDTFGHALSFSGVPDFSYEPHNKAAWTSLMTGIELELDVPVGSIFGLRSTDELNWRAQDPTTMATNLAATDVTQYIGSGLAGPLDDPAAQPDTTEALAKAGTLSFARRMTALGLAHRLRDYGPGTHTWPYWRRDLQQSLPQLMAAFRSPLQEPARVAYTSAEDTYTQYGWSVRLTRPAQEFSTLNRASCSRFVLSGSGRASVTTPPCFQPGRRYTATRTGAGSGRTTQIVTASSQGRLTLDVPLGTGNPFRQYTAESLATTTAVYSTEIAIAWAGG